ncbi:hypothetical protein TIFTF001_041844 [Ficus carica]|uniref:Uncharacterized protein n=1 Tax=Ficus carica TaxID=3494 RepID=A0AA88CSA8_FICCA|nr:hypothetical protein TIFTF001_041805 [Ficus carica]GMN32898.1 hypothetical protein TIFTF001_041807 [Ficus carica]GMN33141.1 hypothetical protein TIFTF001_041841 [Ficus carica]GMN33151.1 hypothetical protein TIFTF001_041844 [Ficus carica]
MVSTSKIKGADFNNNEVRKYRYREGCRIGTTKKPVTQQHKRPLRPGQSKGPGNVGNVEIMKGTEHVPLRNMA